MSPRWSSDIELFLHLGLPKTGTTTLQENLFEHHPAINNLGRPFFGKNDAQWIAGEIKSRGEILFQPEPLHNRIESKLASQFRENRINVFSDEGFTSFYGEVVDLGLIARRLREGFPGAKILISLRNQYTFITSRYVQWLNLTPPHQRTPSLEEWLERLWYIHQSDSADQFQVLHYYELIEYYARLFGRENIHVLLFEELVKNKDAYCNRLSNIMDIDTGEILRLLQEEKKNKRMTRRFYWYRKLRSWIPTNLQLGSLLPTTLVNEFKKNLRSGRTLQPSLPEKWKERLYGLCAEGNRKLQQDYDLDLTTHGYPT